MNQLLKRVPPRAWIAAFLVLSAAIYVGNTWSPSSYAIMLRRLEAPDDGRVDGIPRSIRSDEWAVITPLTQATVNNGLKRYNATSYYQEDLRSTYSMPILDWGLAFKPSMWLYPLVNAAYAYSFHHFTITALFLFGYALLFMRLGMRWLPAGLLSVLLFFTGFTQTWWTTIGPNLAYYPWLLWTVLWEGPLRVRVPLFYWLASCCMLSSFYPPLLIPLAFVAVVLLLAFAPSTLRRPRPLIGFAVAAGLACLTAVLYLQDWLRATLHTVYPGLRRVGGGDFQMDRLLMMVFPTSRIHRHEPLITWTNICELSVVGTFYFLMIPCFLNWAGLGRAWREGRLRPVYFLLPAFLMMAAWLWLPVPPWMGMPLLWNQVPPSRMAFAFGFLFLVMGYVIAEQSGMVLSPLRVLVFSAVVFGAWYHFKLSLHGLGLWESRKDVAIIIPVAIGLVGTMMGRFRGHDAHPLLLGSAAVIAVATFASFNPLQRAWPIFNRPQTERLRNLDITAELAPDKRLVVGGYEGALLNGLGYRSASHVLPTPQVEYFHRMMPELSEARVNEVFNRYAHITLTNSLEPHVIGPDAVAVPVRIFQTPRERDRWIVFSPSTHAPPPQSPPAIGEREAGFVDEVRLEDHALTIRGWAPWVGLTGRQGLKIYLSHPAMEASLESEPRPDVMAANPGQGFSHNGFVARLTLPPELPLPPPEALRVCVVAVDQDTGDAMHLRFSGDAAASPGPGVECPPSAPLQTATQSP